MSKKRSKLSLLAARKNLLVLESDLNRALLRTELAEIKHSVDRLVQHAYSLGRMASLAAEAGAAIKAVRGLFGKRPEPGKQSGNPWWSAALRGARAAALIWSIVRMAKR